MTPIPSPDRRAGDPEPHGVCPECRAATDREDGFCGECGTRLGGAPERRIRCPFCKEEIRDRSPRCRTCGADLTPIWSGEALCPRCGTPPEFGRVPLTSRDLYGVFTVAMLTAAVALWLSPRMGTVQAFGFLVVPVYFILTVVTLKLRFDRRRLYCPRCGMTDRTSWESRPWVMMGILLAVLLILLTLLVLENAGK
jgi:hypothetical protein